jgi:UDP-3-O-[3-hydroxymyristoyl] glucosamine N-acyltransferase
VVRELSDLVRSTSGDLSRPITHAAPLSAAGPGSLTFARAQGPALRSSLQKLEAVTLICADGTEHETSPLTDVTVLRVGNPRYAFARTVNALLSTRHGRQGVHPSAVVDATARVHASAWIGPLCVVGEGCVVGAGSVLNAGVVLYDNVRLGRNVIVHSGTVIGADGFGYERADDGALEKFPHLGGVVIEDDVEIGSNTSIDRGSLGDTLIKRGAKIDNQVHISHNVVVGEASVVIAQSMIGGSVSIGDRSWIAPSACVMNQRKIGSGATVGLQALVVKDVLDDGVVMGAPATPQTEFQRTRAALKKLADGSL